MKKTVSLTLICCLPFFISFAQSYPLEFRPEASGFAFNGGPGSWQMRIAANEPHHTALISFADRSDVYYYLVDTQFNVIHQYSESKDSLTFNYYGSKYDVILQAATGSSFVNYILKKNSNEVFVETPDFDQGISVFNKFIVFPEKEKFLTAFVNNGHVYFLTHRKNSSQLNFYKDSNPIPNRVNLEMRDSLPDFDLEGSLNGEIKVIKESKEPGLIETQAKAKLYLQPAGSLVLTLDKDYRYTVLWRIDIDDSVCVGKKFEKTYSNCNYLSNANAVQTNSFVYQDKLLQAVFCNKDLLMQLKDISTSSVIGEYHAVRDSAIGFASSGLITKLEGAREYKGILEEKEKDDGGRSVKDLKTKEFFKAVNRSELSLLIVPQGDYLVIKTGEAHTVTRQGQGIGFSSFGATGAIISGVRMMFSVEVYASKTGQSETYITTLLKKRDLELVPQTSIVTKYDKIDRLADRLKDIQAAGTAFDFNNNTYFFYWHKKLKKMMIEWVDDPASP